MKDKHLHLVLKGHVNIFIEGYLIIKNDRFLLDKVHLTGYVLQPEPQESKKLILLKTLIRILFDSA